MDIKEKNELIEVIKTDIKNVASLEAKGQFEEAKKMHSELEGKLTKSLEGMVSKEDFDKAENELKKSIKAFEDKTAKNVTFEGALWWKSLADKQRESGMEVNPKFEDVYLIPSNLVRFEDFSIEAEALRVEEEFRRLGDDL
jgi:hypothetical protein